MKRAFARHRPDAPELAKIVSGSTASLKVLADHGSYQIYRFKTGPIQYKVDGVTSHIVCLQHARQPKVNYRIGGDAFCGSWERGTIGILPAEAPRDVTLDQAIDLTAIWLSPSFCARLLETPRFDVRPLFNHRHVVLSHILNLLTGSAEVAGSHAGLYHDGLVTSLVAHLGAQHGVLETAARRGGLPPARLRRVLELIEDELQNEIRLSTLAAAVKISEAHFCMMFRRSTGLSPHRYVVKRRVERAKRLLRSDLSMNITEIAFDVGFKSSSYFSTTFHKSTGVAPLAYRNNA